MTVSTARMNAEQFLQLGADPVGVRLELVNGEVAVSPSPVPRHSFVVVNLILLLGPYIRSNKLGELYQDVDTILDQYSVRRPDVMFFSTARIHLIGEKAMEGPPDLAIELISPSSIEVDRVDKFSQYRDAGVAHYWIIDPAQRTVDPWCLIQGQYVSNGRVQGNVMVKLPPFPNLEIPLGNLWRSS